jgi:hypothetical protein
MPIQINLLAEAQALEDQRRRNPTKRVILGGTLAIIAVLAYSAWLLTQSMVAKSTVTRLVGELNSRTNAYSQILENRKKLDDDTRKLAALTAYATNRFLVGTLLNELQHVGVDHVQLTRLKLEHDYVTIESKASTDKRAPVPPPKITEKITLTLSARDDSPNPGDAVNKFQEALAALPYFQNALRNSAGFRLTNLGAPQSDADGRSFILFTLQARYPEITR